MIVRKPYAFLIKNFRKIHIFLLILCGYIYYVNMSVRSFVSDFISLGTYDSYLEPISKYINFFTFISLILIAVSCFILLILLKHKNKPWKLYLLPVLEYSFILVIYFITINYFNSYTGDFGSTATIRAIRDLLFITSIFQYPVLLIIIIRIFGVDLNKFNFKADKEYLELNSDDREEVEININIDKESFKRAFKRFRRNVGYVYREHKFIINLLIVFVILVLMGYGYRYFFIINKVYKQGEVLNANNYSININNVYFTNKDKAGNVIEKNHNFVILDLTIKNNIQARKIDFNKFHIINGTSDYTYTSSTYKFDFNDLGDVYDSYEIKRNGEVSLILVFKVSKDLDKDKFVLYYQEVNGYNKTYLRKIKINTIDLSNINNVASKKIGDVININEDVKFSLESMELLDSAEYKYQNCPSSGCFLATGILNSSVGNKILKISFASEGLDGKDMIDFSSKYGKIIYKDSSGNEKVISIDNYLKITYYGKYLYLKVPTELESAQSIDFVYTVRNNKYTYKIR